MEEDKFNGMEYLENHIKNKTPRNICQNCNTKLKIFGTYTIQQPFGLTIRLCKKCYKEYKQNNNLK